MKDETSKEAPVKAEPQSPAGGAVATWDPFERLGMADFFGRLPEWFNTAWAERPTMSMGDIRVEEYTEDGALVIRGEIPGVDPAQDIDITVDNGRLSIRATREQRVEDEENGYRSEFRYGSFGRMITLPRGADADAVTASYDNGILEVRVPLADEEQQGRKIEISH